MTYHTGRAAGTNGKTAVQYRHIENPYGNVFEFIDGINFSDGTVYVCLNPASYADDTAANYTNIGSKIQSDGDITAIGVSSAMPWAFYPTAVGGSETTYIPDFAYYYSGWRVLLVGGGWSYGGGAGLFGSTRATPRRTRDSSVGARLLFTPNGGPGAAAPGAFPPAQLAAMSASPKAEWGTGRSPVDTIFENNVFCYFLPFSVCAGRPEV